MIIGQIPLYGDDNVLTKLFDIRGEGGEINNPLSSKDVSDTDFGNRNVIKNLFSIGAWGSEESSEGNMLKVKMLNHPERGHQGRAEARQHFGFKFQVCHSVLAIRSRPLRRSGFRFHESKEVELCKFTKVDFCNRMRNNSTDNSSQG